MSSINLTSNIDEIDDDTFTAIVNHTDKTTIQETLNLHVEDKLSGIQRIPVVSDDVRVNWLKQNASSLTYYIRLYTNHYTFNSSITTIGNRDQVVAKAFLHSSYVLNGDIFESDDIEAEELRTLIPSFLSLFIHLRLNHATNCYITQLYLVYLGWSDRYQLLYRKIVNFKKLIYEDTNILKLKRNIHDRLNYELFNTFIIDVDIPLEKMNKTYDDELQQLSEISVLRQHMDELFKKIVKTHFQVCECYTQFFQMTTMETKLTRFTYEIENLCIMDMDKYGIYRALKKDDSSVVFYYVHHKNAWIQNKLRRPISPTSFCQEYSECVVCYESNCEEPLSCGHRIHRSCVIKTTKTTCPMCRSEVRMDMNDLSELYDKMILQENF